MGRLASEQRVVIQGYGKVGAPLVKLLSDRGMKVVGVADIRGAIHVPAGIDPTIMANHFKEAGTIVGYPDSEPVAADLLFTLPSDIAIPAALGGVIDQDIAKSMSASIVVEAANGPTTGEGAAVLASRGIAVVPDVLANAGGVVASYFEWARICRATSGSRNSFTTDWKRRCARPSTTSGLVTSNLKSRCAKRRSPSVSSASPKPLSYADCSLIEFDDTFQCDTRRSRNASSQKELFVADTRRMRVLQHDPDGSNARRARKIISSLREEITRLKKRFVGSVEKPTKYRRTISEGHVVVVAAEHVS